MPDDAQRCPTYFSSLTTRVFDLIEGTVTHTVQERKEDEEGCRGITNLGGQLSATFGVHLRELPMTKEELAHFERRLLEARARIIKRLAQFDELSSERLRGSDDGGLAYTFHMADQGTDAMEREKAFLLASKEGRFLYHIDQALRRLYKTPELYGLCGECGSEIGNERLDALPHARLCIRCKEGEENATTQYTAAG